MYITIPLFAAFVFYPLAVHSQATPQQTIVPFSTLPSCAANCGHLYDAQGACSPPVVPSTSLSCFCSYGSLQPFYAGTAGVCDNACPSSPTDLTKIQQWFIGLCSKGTATATPGSSPTTTSTNTGTGTAVAGNGADNGPDVGSSGPSNQSWINTHYQWIIMVVVLALGIILGWIGACLLRRRYVRRKEREYELRPPVAPWVAGQPTAHPGPPGTGLYGDGMVPKGKERDSGMFVSRPPPPPPAARMSEKTEGPKKWIVTERT